MPDDAFRWVLVFLFIVLPILQWIARKVIELARPQGPRFPPPLGVPPGGSGPRDLRPATQQAPSSDAAPRHFRERDPPLPERRFEDREEAFAEHEEFDESEYEDPFEPLSEAERRAGWEQVEPEPARAPPMFRESLASVSPALRVVQATTRAATGAEIVRLGAPLTETGAVRRVRRRSSAMSALERHVVWAEILGPPLALRREAGGTRPW